MLADDYEALKSHFVSNWSDDILTVYDNQPNVTIPENTTYVRFSVRAGSARHDAGGRFEGLKRQLGRVWLTICVPHQTGEGAAIMLADTFATMFRNARLGALGCGVEDISTTPDDGNGYYVMSVSVPWESLRRYT